MNLESLWIEVDMQNPIVFLYTRGKNNLKISIFKFHLQRIPKVNVSESFPHCYITYSNKSIN